MQKKNLSIIQKKKTKDPFLTSLHVKSKYKHGTYVVDIWADREDLRTDETSRESQWYNIMTDLLQILTEKKDDKVNISWITIKTNRKKSFDDKSQERADHVIHEE